MMRFISMSMYFRKSNSYFTYVKFEDFASLNGGGRGKSHPLAPRILDDFAYGNIWNAWLQVSPPAPPTFKQSDCNSVLTPELSVN